MTKTLALVLLAGCASLAPKYERPPAPVPAQLDGGAGDGTAADLPWREFVRDPKLAGLVTRALTENRDLRRAATDIAAAQAQFRIQRSRLFPYVDASATVTSTRSIVGADNATARSTAYGVGLGVASWEVDLFGRIKSLSNAAMQQYLATVETARALRITLIGEVSLAYIAYAADQSRIVIAKQTMESSHRTMDLTDKLVSGGISNRSDYWQASTVYEQARADVASLTATVAQDRNAITLLVGAPVSDAELPQALPEALDWFVDVPVGASSAILLARPDILAAEHQLQAANANLGAARAAFFPNLTITATGGLASTALGALFSGPALVWTLAPRLAMPLFRAGANRANLRFTEAQRAGLVAAYEGAIQRAFRETADALATRATIAEQLDAQTALVAASKQGYDLAEARYEAGIETFLTTLITQRQLYGAQQSFVATQQAALANRVTLYRVLGGGLE